MKHIPLIAIMLLTLTAALGYSAEKAKPAVLETGINVRDLGAVGDGEKTIPLLLKERFAKGQRKNSRL